MNRSPSTNSIILAAAIALVLSIGLYIYLYRDTWELTDKAIAAREVAAREADRQRESKDIRALAERAAPSTESMRRLFVPAEDAVAFIQAVESAGAASGASVSITSITASPMASAKPGTVGTITANIAVSGSWASVMRAVELLETLPYKSSVDKLTLMTTLPTAPKSGQASQWQSVISMTAATLK